MQIRCDWSRRSVFLLDRVSVNVGAVSTGVEHCETLSCLGERSSFQMIYTEGQT